MLDKILSVVASNAKLVVAGAIGAALVAGGSAVAISNVSDNSTTAPSVSSHASDQGALASAAKGDNRSDTATANIPPKPPKPPKPAGTPKGCHGALVSAAAHGTTHGRAHGAAVKLAAHDKSCQHANAGTHTPDANDPAEAPDNESPEAPDAAEGPDNESGSGTDGSNHTSGVHGQSGTHSHR